MEIELSNIKYKNRLNDFNCKFDSNCVTSIIGKSGSGKSLIGYIIMDLVNRDGGSISVDGVLNYDKDKFMKDVGYVFQNPFDHFFCKTVREEIAFGLKQFRFKLNKINIQISESLKMVGLDDSFLERKLNTLSSGEACMVAIASSLVLNPKVLILDEPTVYLDNNLKNKLMKLIKMLRDKYHNSVILMSNDVDFVYSVSDKYILIDSYQIIRSGDIEEVMSNNKLLESYGYEIPYINQFVQLVRDKKNVMLNYTNDIDKLVMDVINNER